MIYRGRMNAVDPATYAWLSQTDLGEAACVTAATGVGREEIARAFGADVSSPQPRATTAEGDDDGPRTVSFTELDGRQVAVEINGSRGSVTDVLLALSGNGRAASAFWNDEEEVRFACAEQGVLLYDGEFGYDGTEGLPEQLVPLVQLVTGELEEDDSDSLGEDGAADDGDAAEEAEIGEENGAGINAVALAMLETFTGARLVEADVSPMLRESFVIG